jgi:predicted transcriptional regulator
MEEKRLFPLLWQGGEFGYYFTLPKRATHWREVTNPDHIPTDDIHTYFGVHPTRQKVQGRASGKDIACINCVFADFDNKDFGGEDATLEQINKSSFSPSVIINSGGGFHAYWLLKDTFHIQDEQARTRASSIQSRWVDMLDADPNSKDLARILRVPGTVNNKYKPPRKVKFYKINTNIRYDIDVLEAILPELLPIEIKSNGNYQTPDIEKVRDTLDRLTPWRCDEYHSWINVGMALQEMGGDGLALWDQWSQGSSKYIPGDCEKRWESFKGDGVTLGSLFYWADHDNPQSKHKPEPAVETNQPDPQPEFEEEPRGDILSSPQVSWTVSDLIDTEFPEPRWAIPGIIPEGLSIIGGRPKVGKSWLMLQAAWSVGTGGRFFDQKVDRGDVFYLALEDSPRRLKDRITVMGINKDAMITFRTRMSPLHQQGMNELLIELERVDYRMVIIDTLTRSIPGVDQKKSDGVIGRIFDELQRLAITRNLAIVLVDHTRKPTGFAADPVDDILHTTSKTAIADSILALYKEQGKAGAKLLGRGRDFEDVELNLQFDSATRAWQIDTPDLSENFDDILDALDILGKSQVTEIARTTSQNKGNVHKRMMRLLDLGMVTREKIGRNVYFERVRSK